MSGIFAPPLPTNGDELSDALARQKALAARIASQRKQVAQLNALQSDLKDAVAAAQSALAGINADQATVQAKIARVGTQVAAVRSNLADLNSQIGDLNAQLTLLEAQEIIKASELEFRKSVLADRLRAAYDTGRTSLLETILTASSFTDVVADVGYYLDYGTEDQALADQIQSDQQVLATMHQTTLETKVETKDLQVQAEVQQQKLNARMAELRAAQAELQRLEAQTARELRLQRATLNRLARNKKALAAAIASESASQAELKKKIDDLVRQQFQHGNIPSVFNGTMIWPMPGIVSQEFGCTGFPLEPPLGSCSHFHQGIDIVAPAFTPIRAAADGTVVFVGPNPYDPYPKAWIVIIAHSESLQTWYAHLDNGGHPPAVSAGQFVRQGQVIGYEGMTGHTTGYHLHWAVEFNGAFVNPRLFV